jgi:glycosyltransferase involved in cell wall biosynthesis
MNNIVSIIIPTRNSDRFLENTLKSIKKQTYKYIETIIVDGKSTDKTLEIAKKYNITVLIYVPKVPKGTFDAPHKRNYGVRKSKGTYVYYVDADMELEPNVIKEAVSLTDAGGDAIIIPEDSFGEGIWAQAKNLERRCYWGDDTIEAPRFFVKKVWQELGGLDESLGGGGDDWDLHQKVKDKGYQVARTKSMVMHNEGKLSLKALCRKRFMYGRDTFKYIQKRPKSGSASYFPVRKAFLKNWKLFLKRPKDSGAFLIMRSAEYFSGFSGIVYSVIKK